MRWIEDIRADWDALDVRDVRLRRFGFLITAVLLGAAAYGWRAQVRTPTLPLTVLLFLAGVLLAVSLFFPQGLRLFYKIWMGLAFILGWFVSRIILIFLFYTVLTPLGFLARLFGKRFLDTKTEAQAETYWKPVKESGTDLTRMY
jgi:hypothetical protein